jgi:hypothetical protein
MPRNFIKRLAFAVVEGNEQAVRDALKRAATNPNTVMRVLDLAAKLNREIGSGAEASGGTTIINLKTNVNLLALRAAGSRAAQPASVEAAAPPRRLPRVPRVSERHTDHGSARGGR